MRIDNHNATRQSPDLIRAFAIMAIAFTAMLHSTGLSAFEQKDSENIPHASSRAKDDFIQYQYASDHKAFAIAPGGAWYWVTEAVSEEQAEKLALENCQANTQQKCVLYALDDQIVFDAKRWSGLWGPYADALTASKAPVGVKVGERFPDLSWIDGKGKKTSVSEHRGKIVFLHFWGSWCPPCLREFPSLKTLHEKLTSLYSKEIEMVMMQLREPFDESMRWIDEFGFKGMPVYDSGAIDDESVTLTLKDGSQINDRDIARVFPSTYIIDRNGLVLFSHNGPVSDWLDYIDLIGHAVAATTGPGTSKAEKVIVGPNG